MPCQGHARFTPCPGALGGLLAPRARGRHLAGAVPFPSTPFPSTSCSPTQPALLPSLSPGSHQSGSELVVSCSHSLHLGRNAISLNTERWLKKNPSKPLILKKRGAPGALVQRRAASGLLPMPCPWCSMGGAHLASAAGPPPCRPRADPARTWHCLAAAHPPAGARAVPHCNWVSPVPWL